MGLRFKSIEEAQRAGLRIETPPEPVRPKLSRLSIAPAPKEQDHDRFWYRNKMAEIEAKERAQLVEAIRVARLEQMRRLNRTWWQKVKAKWGS